MLIIILRFYVYCVPPNDKREMHENYRCRVTPPPPTVTVFDAFVVDPGFGYTPKCVIVNVLFKIFSLA